MADITIASTDRTRDGYQFAVHVDEGARHSSHTVTMDEGDYERWAAEGDEPAAVAHRALSLLLDRVAQEELMARFDLREAVHLYPEFEREVSRRSAL